MREWNLWEQNTDHARCVCWVLRNITDPKAIDSAIHLAGTIQWFNGNPNHNPPYDLIVSTFEACFDSTKQLYPGMRDRAYFSARAILQINTVIIALNGAGVIPAEEGQDVGRVLREDRLTATRCKLEIKRARRLYVGGCEVGRVGTKPEDIRSVWKVLKDGGRLGGLRDDLECSGVTRNARG